MSLITASQKITGPHGSTLVKPKDVQLQFRAAHTANGKKGKPNPNCPFCEGSVFLHTKELERIGNGNWKAARVSLHHPEANEPVPLHQIVLPTRGHNVHFSGLSDEELALHFMLLTRACTSIGNRRDVAQVNAFTKETLLSFVPIGHPHTHVIGMHELNGATLEASKFLQHGSCYFCQIAEKGNGEYALAAAKNTIAQNERFLAFCPPDAQYEYHVSIVPMLHVSSLDSLSERALGSLAQIFGQVARALDAITGCAPLKVRYRATTSSKGPDFHFHISIAPRIIPYAGFEKSREAMPLLASPAQRAEELRAAIASLQ